MSPRFLFFFYISVLSFGVLNAQAKDFASTYAEVKGLINQYCSDCHNPNKKKGSLDFSIFDSFESIYRNRRVWNNVIEQVMNGEMPPRKKAQPSEAQKKKFITWIETHTQDIDCSNIDDPGQIVIRRLNRSEYDNTIRDLTGLELNLAKNFPVQGGGGEGFDNNSEVMFFPAIYMEKYLEAAKSISNHAHISYSKGIQFLPETIESKNPSQYRTESQFNYNAFFSEWRSKQPKVDWKKEFQNYSKAAMELIIQHPKSKNYDETMLTFSKIKKVNAAYLENFRSYLANKNHENPWAKWSVKEWYRVFLDPKQQNNIDYEKLSQVFTEKNLYINKYRNPKSISHEHKFALNGKRKLYISLGDAGDGHEYDHATLHNPRVFLKNGKSINLIDCKLLEHRGEGQVQFKQREDKSEFKLNQHGQKIQNGLECKVPALLVFELPEQAKEFRGHFGVSDLGQGKAMIQAELSLEHPDFPKPWNTKGVLLCGPGNKLSEQSPHLSWIDNYIAKKIFKASESAIRKLLNKDEQLIYNQLKNEKDLAYRYPEKEIQNLINKHNPAESKALKLEAWPEKQRKQYHTYQDKLVNTKKWLDDKVIKSLHQLAEKAYRKPLSESEFQPLKAIYLAAMKSEDNFQKAAKQVIQKLFISPDFLYRFEENHLNPEPQPVSDIELANRLSYFIWSSMPDSALMEVAKSGQLHNPEVLKRETLRMLKDPKSKSIAREFAAQWLSLRQLKGERRPNAEIYKHYNDGIRDAMIDEATYVFHDMVQNNHSILTLINSSKTYLNEPLARYYSIPNIKGNHFRAVDVKQHGRGGLLGLGAVHVSTSYPDRTSPILRGLWILETLLGNPTPPPPEDVPINESQMADPNLTIKEKFAVHRDNPSCAICHDRIDPIGFTLEGFDATGKLRTHEGKHAIDNLGELKNGTKLKGPQGLREYILNEKRDEYLHHFTEKLLGFALGRSLDYYDDCTIETILEKTHQNHYRFNDIVVEMVKSLPFRFRRGIKTTAHAHP